MIIDSSTKVRWSEDHLAANVDGDVMLMSIAHGRYVGLDTISSDIWRRLQEPQAVGALCQSLARDYDADPKTIEREVIELLGKLHEQGLIGVEG